MSKLKLYYDPLYQPSRCVFIFLHMNKIPFEPVEILLAKGENKTEEFKKINPLQLVPVIDDHGLIIKESVGILRYLSRKYSVPDYLYPEDIVKQAKVDEYLEWQHLGTRYICGTFFKLMWRTPLQTKVPPEPKLAAETKELLNSTIDTVEKVWLGDKPYICGDHLTIADLFAITEIEQTRLGGYNPKDGRPKLAAWMERVRQDTNPAYDIAHKVLNSIVEKL